MKGTWQYVYQKSHCPVHMRKKWPCISGTHQRNHPHTQDSPAGDDDDIFCDARHFLDGQVAHPTEGGLVKKWEKLYDL